MIGLMIDGYRLARIRETRRSGSCNTSVKQRHREEGATESLLRNMDVPIFITTHRSHQPSDAATRAAMRTPLIAGTE